MDLHIGEFAARANNQSSKATSAKASIQDTESLRRICQEFESIFIGYLMKSMRKTIPENELTTGGSSSAGFSKSIYLSMMDESIAKAVSKANGIGLAAVLYRQLSQSKID